MNVCTARYMVQFCYFVVYLVNTIEKINYFVQIYGIKSQYRKNKLFISNLAIKRVVNAVLFENSKTYDIKYIQVDKCGFCFSFLK